MRLDARVAQISRSRRVAASPQQVWDVLADFGSISSWVANVDHSCVLEHGPTGTAVGTSRRIQVGRDTLVERITEFDQPVALAYTIEGLPRRLRRVTNRWSLTQVSPASTAVTLTTTVEIGANPVARLAERALCRFMSKQSDAMLAGLAARVEGR
jgi:ribosome-associated toxin RatA of RatAB toxin-antitoxin module